MYELGLRYDGEQVGQQMLLQIIDELRDRQLKGVLHRHEEQTRQQIQNLEHCFQILSSQPHAVTDHTLRAHRQNHQTFVGHNPPLDILTMFMVGEVLQTLHHEIAAYRCLAERARCIGQEECARLLEENGAQEERTSLKVEQLGRQFAREALQQPRQKAA